jgi:hypothetical protein
MLWGRKKYAETKKKKKKKKKKKRDERVGEHLQRKNKRYRKRNSKGAAGMCCVDVVHNARRGGQVQRRAEVKNCGETGT